MLQFQPIGFHQQALTTDLGVMAYYTPQGAPWRSPEAEGADLPPLVFLHSLGGGSSAFEWSRFYPALASSYRVIAPDLIGWGQSTHPVRDYRVADYCGVIATLLESVARQPAVVVASSLTAGVTVQLAIARPELFKGLFLISPSGNGDFGRDYRLSLPAQVAATPGVDKLLYQVGAANEMAVSTFLSNFLFADPQRISPEIIKGYLAGTQQPNAEYAALASLRGDICFDLARFLPQLTTRTAFVWGEKSRFSSPDFGRRLAKLNPQAVEQFHVVAAAGVLPHLERPAAVVPLLESFLDAIEQ
ncbi:alpha/beta hydrolase [filamentous cyanobacterium CCP5]|nr:alpha/beta hydrolase [filamentous cyanobacterium CCP5]